MAETPDPELLRLEQAIAALPAIQRDILLAHRLDALTCAEIARRHGVGVGRVERHLAAAMCKIVRQLDGIPLRWWERWF